MLFTYFNIIWTLSINFNIKIKYIYLQFILIRPKIILSNVTIYKNINFLICSSVDKIRTLDYEKYHEFLIKTYIYTGIVNLVYKC